MVLSRDAKQVVVDPDQEKEGERGRGRRGKEGCNDEDVVGRASPLFFFVARTCFHRARGRQALVS